MEGLPEKGTLPWSGQDFPKAAQVERDLMGKFACLPSLLAGESIRSAAAAVAIRSHVLQVPSVALWNRVGLQGTKLGPRTTDASSSWTEQLMDAQPLWHADGHCWVTQLLPRKPI